MNETESLITLARRYCIINYNYWSEKYQKERKGNGFHYTYSKKDYNLFPRYNAIAAIKLGVESIVGKCFDSIEQCKSVLIDIGNNSQSIFTTGTKNDIEEKSIQEERLKFNKYILDISDLDLINVEPLPYFRKLSDKESESIRNDIYTIWNFNGEYWVPLQDKYKDAIFLTKKNISKKDCKDISRFIITNSDNHLIMLSEDRFDYELDKHEFNPDCYETVYTDRTFSWIIYGSHEGTLAFGGTKLIDKIMDIYNERKDLINKW